MNTIAPHSVARVKLVADANQMENVMLFRSAASAFGVPDAAMCATADVWEAANTPKLIATLEALAEVVGRVL